METIQDFEDMLLLLNKHGAKYLIVGGLAFIYHAKPRYTKDVDIWIEPDRIDILQRLEGVSFSAAWENRITDKYGHITAAWIDIDDLIRVKEKIDHPRHQEDVRVLREVKRLRRESG